MTTHRSRLVQLLAFFAVLALLACSKTYLHAETARGDGVTVQPTQVWIGGHKLWVRVNVMNESPEPILVDRDAIVARLPNGQTVERAVGRTSLHGAYTVPPGGFHAVYVEFEERGFDWDTVPSVTIDFTRGITRGGMPVRVLMTVGL
jgi:hypothetical protein